MENENLPFDDLDELDDFDLSEQKYQVWVFRYDKEQKILDDTTLVAEFEDPESAITKGKELVEELDKFVTPESYYLQVEVETVVTRDGCEENIATIFQENIQMKEI